MERHSAVPEKHRFLTRHLFLQVRDELAARIATGVWRAGGMVPNEAQLSAELNVSQGTVRKALDMLEAEKIVLRKQGRGTFVIDHDTEEMAIRFSSIYSSAGLKIDGHIVCEHSSAGPATDVDRSHMDVTGSDTVFRSTRVHWHSDHPFMIEKSTLAMRHFSGLSEAGLKCQRLTSLAQRHGVHLACATEIVRPMLCPLEFAGKLGISTDTPILHIERTVHTDRNVRVEWRQAWCYLHDKHYMSIVS